mgnify:CR=1 FL=1
MFVEPSGHITGSIGGGKVEYEVINHCKEVQEKEVKTLCLNSRRPGQSWNDLRRTGDGGI